MPRQAPWTGRKGPPISISKARAARDLFLKALDLEPGARAAFLDTATATDPDLRREVDRLFSYHARSGELLEGVEATLRQATQPEFLGPYRVIRPLGEGGMSRVFLAVREDAPAGTPPVAVKVLRPLFAEGALTARALREIEVLRTLDHPGIARFIDSGWLDAKETQPFLVIEYVDGLDLAAWVAAERPDRPTRLRLLLELCRAVDHAHARGVVHRDLKPQNTLIQRADGTLKVLDFGLARLREQQGTRLSRTGQIIGTLRYMSPEQAEGRREVGPATDQHALAVIGYELLTGRLPYDVSDDTPVSSLRALLTQEPRRLSRSDPSIGRGFDAVFAKALSREPAARYASVAAFAEDLERVIAGHRPLARSVSWGSLRRVVARRRRVITSVVVLAMGLAAAAILVQRRMAALDTSPSAVEAHYQALLGELTDVDRVRHAEDLDRDGILECLPRLQRAREILDRLPPRPYSVDLRHYILWRQGELHYFLGKDDEDPKELDRAYRCWYDARATSRKRGALQHLGADVAIRGRIEELSAAQAKAGLCLARGALAFYRTPSVFYREAAVHAKAAIETLDWPDTAAWPSLIGPAPPSSDLQRRTELWMDLVTAQLQWGVVADSLELVMAALRSTAKVDSLQRLRHDPQCSAWAARQRGRVHLERAEVLLDRLDDEMPASEVARQIAADLREARQEFSASRNLTETQGSDAMVSEGLAEESRLGRAEALLQRAGGARATRLEEAAELARRAAALRERSGRPMHAGAMRLWLAATLLDLAESSTDGGSRLRAIDAADSALTRAEQAFGSAAPAQMGRSLCLRGRLERQRFESTGDPDARRRALESLDRSIELLPRALDARNARQVLRERKRLGPQAAPPRVRGPM